MEVPQLFATFVVEENILVAHSLLKMDPKRHQPLSQRKFSLRSQMSLITKDSKRFGYLKLLDFLLYGSKNEKWFLNSGCSRHMTGDESKFVFLIRRKLGYVTFRDNGKGKILDMVL